MGNNVKKTVILIHPRVHPTSEYCQVPLGILAVAGPLEKAGYDLLLVDAMVDQDYKNKILSRLDSAICVGISCMTGYQIQDGLAIAKAIREKDAGITIVWGGWHPCVAPEQTIAHPLVDAVVIGQGETAMLEITRCLERSLTLRGVKGVFYKENGAVVKNDERPYEDINSFPPIPYHLVDVEKYLIKGDELGDRVINFISSRGCPFQCGFCAEFKVNKRRWSALSAERVASEIGALVAAHKIDGVIFNDSNFFVDKSRVERICRGLIGQNLSVKWGKANGHPRHLLNYSAELWSLMYKSGLRSILIGAESGSQQVLDLIKKECTVEELERLAELCRRFGVKIWYSFILGLFPDPVSDGFRQTLALIKTVKSIDPDSEVLVFSYVAYPGTPLYERAGRLGLAQPASLEDWAGYILDNTNCSLAEKSYQEDLEPLVDFYLPLAYRLNALKIRMHKSLLKSVLFTFFHELALFRCAHNLFIFPWEWYLYKHIGRRFKLLN